MSIKEKVISEAIERIEKRIKEIKKIVFSNPLSDIIKLRQDVYPKIKSMDILDPELIKIVSEAAKKEKSLFKLADRQIKESVDLISELAKIQNELGTLKSEQWMIQQRKNGGFR